MLYTSPSRSSFSHRIPPISCGRLCEKTSLKIDCWIPTPGRHFNPIRCFSLASLPQSAKFKSVLKDRMTPRELIASAPASVRRNKEKSAGSRHPHEGGRHHARQGSEWKSI